MRERNVPAYYFYKNLGFSKLSDLSDFLGNSKNNVIKCLKQATATQSCEKATSGWLKKCRSCGKMYAADHGAHTVILGWYYDEEAAKNELRWITAAMKSGETLYELKYFTNVKISAFGTAKRTE